MQFAESLNLYLGKPCGDKIGSCDAPADACAKGWEPCLSNATVPSSKFALDAFRAAISPNDCHKADPTRAFVTAMSHADKKYEDLPPKPCPPNPLNVDNGCIADDWGSEPVCCGGGCQQPICPNDVWMGGTYIKESTQNGGCGSLEPNVIDGVLCCKIPTTATAERVGENRGLQDREAPVGRTLSAVNVSTYGWVYLF